MLPSSLATMNTSVCRAIDLRRLCHGLFGWVLLLSAIVLTPAFAQDDPHLPVPPRIGMVSGEASFWRPGATDWAPAQVNMPLAAGDAVYTGDGASLELQIGPRAYVRLAQNAMVTLLDDRADGQQFKVASGIVSFDLRGVAGRSIEIDTPDGAFTIDKPGYYRAEIADGNTHFTVRRGGEAIATLADGNTRLIAPSQEAVVEAGDGVRDVDTYVASDMDTWDRWNLTRTDDLVDAISNRYVPADVYGTDDLDRYGDWRTTSEYGAVWVPSGVDPDWAPYSAGSWVWDPVYSWTWVDTAPWGWAPYHYGRWVHLGGYWAWAPGPRHVRPVYAPALVAFFHSGGTTVSISSGPAVSWVALGWGEPCVPWWGRREFAGRPWWGGWGGPRVVNNTVIQRNTVINNITINNTTYRNLQQRNAVIGVPERDFGRGRLKDEHRFTGLQQKEFAPIGGRHPVRPAAASLVPTMARSVAPAPNVLSRPAVAVREPPRQATPWRSERRNDARAEPQVQRNAPENRIVKAKPSPERQIPAARFGSAGGEERRPLRQPPEPPQFGNAPREVQRQRDDNRNDNADRQPRQGSQWQNNAPRPVPLETPRENVRPPDTPRTLERADRPEVARPDVRNEIRAVTPRQQEPIHIEPVPPQRPPAWQREAPQMPAPVPRREVEMRPVPPVNQMPQRQPPTNVAPQRPPQQDMHREIRRQDTPLPGQPANQMYRGHGEQQRRELGR